MKKSTAVSWLLAFLLGIGIPFTYFGMFLDTYGNAREKPYAFVAFIGMAVVVVTLALLMYVTRDDKPRPK